MTSVWASFVLPVVSMDILFPPEVGIQSRSVVSNKSDDFPLIKCCPQTHKVEFFSKSWQAVRFL